MSAWSGQNFQAVAANGGVVRRSRADIDKYSLLQEIIQEFQQQGFHVIETGGRL